MFSEIMFVLNSKFELFLVNFMFLGLDNPLNSNQIMIVLKNILLFISLASNLFFHLRK